MGGGYDAGAVRRGLPTAAFCLGEGKAPTADFCLGAIFCRGGGVEAPTAFRRGQGGANAAVFCCVGGAPTATAVRCCGEGEAEAVVLYVTWVRSIRDCYIYGIPVTRANRLRGALPGKVLGPGKIWVSRDFAFLCTPKRCSRSALLHQSHTRTPDPIIVIIMLHPLIISAPHLPLLGTHYCPPLPPLCPSLIVVEAFRSDRSIQ